MACLKVSHLDPPQTFVVAYSYVFSAIIKLYSPKGRTRNIQYTMLKVKQESPAIADKPARRESLPKIAPIRRG